MSKFFLAPDWHVKGREFLELKQGSMTILEYVAKFTELSHFRDDYVATNMEKVRKFEDGLKLYIRGKIVGFLLQDMDSMVRTTMAIEREWTTWEALEIRVLVTKERRASLLLVRERSRRLLVYEGFRDKAVAIKAKARSRLLIS